MSKNTKIYISILFITFLLIGAALLFYLKVLPAVISDYRVINYVQNFVRKSAGIDCIIESPNLRTELSPKIKFAVKNLEVSKDKKELISIQNFDSVFDLRKILAKKIIIKKLGADYIFVDADGISKLASLEQKQGQKSDFSIDWFSSFLYIKKALIVYNPTSDLSLKICANNLKITETKNPKFVRFDIAVDIQKNKEKLTLKINDNNKVFIDKKKLFVNGSEFFINKSKIAIHYIGSQEKKFNLNLVSDKFYAQDLVELISSDLFVPNGEEMFALLKDINGTFNFNLNLSDKGINGNINLDRINCKIIMLNNIPVVLNKGNIKIDNDKIVLSDLDGYHGNSSGNKLTFSGKITDYQKSFNADIVGFVFANKDFTNNYLSKAAGVPIELVGKTIAKVKFKMKNNKIDTSVIFRLLKGYDILIDGASFSPVNYERACRADIVIENNNLELKNLNYYIADSFKAGVEAKPLVRVYGNFDMLKNMDIKNLGFEIPKPLPSEFLNVLIGQRIFRKGLIAGNLEYINLAKVPFLKGRLSMDSVRIPSQRLFIKKGELYTDNQKIHIDVNGRFKRSGYKFDGHIANEIKLPVVVKSINLSLDNLDVEKILNSFNNQPQQASENVSITETLAVDNETETDTEDGDVVFNTGLIVVENCMLEIIQGLYKKINFGNVKATMTLNKDGILELHSNKFDIADGISTANVVCDLKNQKYKIRLGIKDVDSNAIAESLLNLPREISGKARGLILLETDKTLKLNGSMKFDIKNGTIAKIGLVQYALNFVALFRNPLAMISPTTVMDLVNVPEGTFDKIAGSLDLKNNVIEKIMIKSQAPQLSTFIIGRYDLEKADATLRIYTKFSNKHKGFAGFMRKFSLNALANRVPLNSRNDSNYYAAEIAQLPEIEADEKDCQIFLTKVDGDVEHNNFLSSLKRIK